jgi:predicted PurR-regulated permease PerM
MLSLLALLGVGYNIHRGIYLVIFTLVIAPVACWLAITAMRRARRDGTSRPRGAIAGTIFSVLAIVFGIGMLALFTLAAKQVSQYSQCLGQAQTLSAQHACTSQFERSFRARLGQTGQG